MSLQVPHRPKEGSTKAVILVGGPSRGTRFRPLSLDVPKPLSRSPATPSSGTASLPLPPWAPSTTSTSSDTTTSQSPRLHQDASKEFPVLSSIKYLREYEALGTAGGLYHFRDAILKGRPSASSSSTPTSAARSP
ncbi:unnamed protein product [Clonostachys rosea f. rosea IK726]|uniref:Uncharacterized protein n=1 Tax=Clonostachys rosea f. rosea IK726 TaxID=1349383 RepID=A0ACA9U7U6_BIOOC|nr:unnamed protein product [Clonostachys rosea f. rosea IK726]